jgi:signal transduction histidine kinase
MLEDINRVKVMTTSLKLDGKLVNEVDKIVVSLTQSISDGKHIKKCVMYIQSILNNTLDMNKLKEGRLDFQFKKVFIRKEVIDMALTMLSTVKTEGVEIVVECEDGIYVNTDALRLTQVFMNLMTNAFKFCKQGRVRIVVKFLTVTSTVELAVEDTGPGVPLEHRHKLFTKYGQVAVRQGTGLGLVLSRVRLVRVCV